MRQEQWKRMYGTTPESFTRRVAFALRETEERPMKRRLTVRTVCIAAAMLVMLMTAGYAAFSSQVAELFGRLYGTRTQEWLAKGDVAVPGEAFALGDVIFTLDEVVYRNNSLFGIGTIRAAEGSAVVIFPEDQQPGDPYGIDVHGAGGSGPEKTPDDAQTFAEVAKERGASLLMVRALPARIGVDGGVLLVPESIGTTCVPQRDGSVLYSFEVSDGVVVEEGETYTLQMWVSVWAFSEEGEALSERPSGERWTVEIAPTPISQAKQGGKV